MTKISDDRLDVLRMSPRQCSVGDIEDLIDEVDRLRNNAATKSEPNELVETVFSQYLLSEPEHITPDVLAAEMVKLAKHMESVAAAMKYMGGFGALSWGGNAVIGWADVLRDWADGLNHGRDSA
jgi:hypothetical protein